VLGVFWGLLGSFGRSGVLWATLGGSWGLLGALGRGSWGPLAALGDPWRLLLPSPVGDPLGDPLATLATITCRRPLGDPLGDPLATPWRPLLPSPVGDPLATLWRPLLPSPVGDPLATLATIPCRRPFGDPCYHPLSATPWRPQETCLPKTLPKKHFYLLLYIFSTKHDFVSREHLCSSSFFLCFGRVLAKLLTIEKI
jgi:hypothetical protein